MIIPVLPRLGVRRSRLYASSGPVSPAYPTVTGDQEFKLEAGALGAVDAQVASWIDDWNSYDFTMTPEAAAVIKDDVFNGWKHVLFSGSQSDNLFVDRGAELALTPGLTVFLTFKSGAFSGAGANHVNVFQNASAAGIQRMSFTARRNGTGNYLAWWDATSTWLETSTSLADNTKYIISFRSDNTSLKIAINGGAEEAVGNPTHKKYETYTIGANQVNAGPFMGSICSAILYTTELSDADRILIRNYLNEKYVIY